LRVGGVKNYKPNMPNIDTIRKKIEFKEFIDWMALPTKERKPSSHKELAEELNVDNGTLSDWKNYEGFWEKVREERMKWVKDKTSNVLLALYKKILKSGNAAEVRVFLEYAGEYEQKLDVSLKEKLTDDEKELLNKALDYAGLGNKEGN